MSQKTIKQQRQELKANPIAKVMGSNIQVNLTDITISIRVAIFNELINYIGIMESSKKAQTEILSGLVNLMKKQIISDTQYIKAREKLNEGIK